LEKELLSDEKEIAEHVMLVDLGRNDIGRVSKFGTVAVKNLMHIERYSHVMHVVTNVQGEIREDKTPFDALCPFFLPVPFRSAKGQGYGDNRRA